MPTLPLIFPPGCKRQALVQPSPPKVTPARGLAGKAVSFMHKGARLFGVAEADGFVRLAVPMEGKRLVAGEERIAIPHDALTAVELEFSNRKFVVGYSGARPFGPEDMKARAIKDKEGVVLDYQDVILTGYASTFENVTASDRQGDAVAMGAFKESLPRFMQNPVMLLDHWNDTRHIAGKWVVAREDSRGLYVEGVVSNAPELRQTRFALMEGSLKTLSIGGIWFFDEDGRTITHTHLFEISLVAIPANPDAIIAARSFSLDDMAALVQSGVSFS